MKRDKLNFDNITPTLPSRNILKLEISGKSGENIIENKHKLCSKFLVSTVLILMLVSITHAETYKFVNDKQITIQPLANFSANVTEGFAPLTVQFNDSTENATSVLWDFGDESNSTERNPVHTFSEAGNYRVNLTASNANGTNSTFTNIIIFEPVAYIANAGSNTVSVIDIATNTVTATMNVGSHPWGIAVTPDGKKVYVANMNSSSISVIDVPRKKVIATVKVGIFPIGVAFTPNGTEAYVANYGSRNITVVDTATNNVTATVNVGHQPIGVAFTPDGKRAYVTNHGSNNVSVINTLNNTVIATVNVVIQPAEVAITSDGKKAYVVDYGGTTVSVIDTTNNTITATVNVGIQPAGVAITPDGTKVYVANYGSNNVSVIDTSNDTVTATINVGNQPSGVAITPDGTKAYVTNYGSNNVSVINTSNNAVITSVAVGVGPRSLGQFIGRKMDVPVVNFTANVTYGYLPLSVQFNDWSTNAVSRNWDFGDGTNSTEQNPIHTFSTIGNYTVNLTESNLNGTNCTVQNISVLNILPVANFSASITSGPAPISVQFNDSSTNAIAWNWNFGDGTNSTLQNPLHTFSSAGNYTVNLTASNINGSSSKTAVITVLTQPAGANLYLSENTLESKHPGSSMTYILYYQNFGDKTAQNVVLEDVLSSNVEFKSASDGGIYYNSARKVIWNIGSVAPAEQGFRTITVEIPLNATSGTVVKNSASIITSDTETRYDDNEISIQTLVASPILPQNVSVEPTIGDAGIPSVYWKENITFSYHSCNSATAVNISIHIDDGEPDIVGNMTGGPSDWNYTTSFYPRTGKATVNYTVYGCNESPISFSIYIDPEGYIYDVGTGNRIAGASVWLQRPDSVGGWENVPTNQSIAQPDVNPLNTDENGMYQWDVLNGTYRVHVEATEYEPKNSYAVMVPPPVTDLHVGLIRISNANYSIFKSVIDPDPTGDCIINRAGDKVPYRIVVKNEGETNLTNVTVNDTLISPLPEPTGDDADPGVLNTGETWTYEAVYTLTSEDVENGSINNNATVTCDQLPEKRSSVNTPVDQNADLSIYKSVIGIDEAGDHIINEIGDIIQYQVAIKNNGNIDLTNVTVSDPMINLTKRTGDSADSGVLNSGETWVFAGNYTVTQEDIDRAKSGNALIENTASVSCNQLPNESSSLDLPIIYIPPNVLTPETENSTGLPVANFSTNVTGGNAPLSVQFTDLSQNALLRSWDFNNDGFIDSTDTNPVYTYLTQGTYTVNLTVSNANGSVSKIASIRVLQTTSSGSGGNSVGSSVKSRGGNSEGKAVIVKNEVNGSTANTAAAANVSPTENKTSNKGQSSTPANNEPTPVQTVTSTPANESKKTPGFELLCGVTGLLAVFLYRRR